MVKSLEQLLEKRGGRTMAKKMKREDMGYNKAKLVCSNCDTGRRAEGQSIYICQLMEEESNWVQPHGFCDFHSTKTFESMLEKARKGFRNHE